MITKFGSQKWKTSLKLLAFMKRIRDLFFEVEVFLLFVIKILMYINLSSYFIFNSLLAHSGSKIGIVLFCALKNLSHKMLLKN